MSADAIAVSQRLQAIAAMVNTEINAACGHNVGFTLIVFTDGRANYISNCKREDSVRGIKELLDLWGMGMPDIPAHDYHG